MKHGLLATILGCALSSAAVGQDAPAPDRARLESRLLAVGLLIEQSTAARQIDSSGDARAVERRNRARDLHRQAQQAFSSGDLALAGRLLPEASAMMFEAVRLAAPEQVTGEKQRGDFEARLESVRSLLAAQKRIQAEKPDTPGAREASTSVERMIAEAQSMAGAARLVEAKARIDQAYLVAKASISSLRAGDTLVRSLNFATKEEEFRYEVDRNDTHRMLIRLLLDGRRADATIDSMVQGFVDKAALLRQDADSASSRGDFGNAIRLLELSTAELVRAIRGAGVFIPG